MIENLGPAVLGERLVNEILVGRPEGRGNPASTGSTMTTIVIAVVLVGVIYLGREVLMPIALAVLMSFVLAPLVGLLQRIYVPRVLAVFLVVLVAFSGVFALGGLMVSQVNQLAGDLPRYQSTLREKIQAVRGAAAGSSTLERASEVLQDLGKELERRAALPAPRCRPAATRRRATSRSPWRCTSPIPE